MRAESLGARAVPGIVLSQAQKQTTSVLGQFTAQALAKLTLHTSKRDEKRLLGARSQTHGRSDWGQKQCQQSLWTKENNETSNVG